MQSMTTLQYICLASCRHAMQMCMAKDATMVALWMLADLTQILHGHVVKGRSISGRDAFVVLSHKD